jgi:hypothetical protein
MDKNFVIDFPANMEETHNYNSVITSFFYFLEHIDKSSMRINQGLEFLAGTLIKCAAHKIYVPYVEVKYGPTMEQLINGYPPSLKNRIEIIDKKRSVFNRVLTYLKPIDRERTDSNIILYNMVVDFLYKIILASKYKAEADVSGSRFIRSIGFALEDLRGHVKSAEARVRLDQIFGIYSSYVNPLKIDTFTIIPSISNPSIYGKISDFLDESKIIELSENRHLLGIPSKTKIALIKIKKCIRHLCLDKRYKKYIQPTSEIIQTMGSTEGIPFPNIAKLKELCFSEYNPPLVDLDYYRVQICSKVNSKSWGCFMFSDGITRSVSMDYFNK